MRGRTYRITGIAMCAAIAYVVMLLGFHFMPSAPFLKYEAKDVILAIAGFIYGPLPALAAAFLVAIAEMFTVSETGLIGFFMNFLAATSFVGVAALAYRRERTARSALGGLVAGSLLMTGMMLLWNYWITPIYMNVPRTVVAGMLAPVFLPFNLVKGGLNTGLTLLIYKPLMKALRAARLLPEERRATAPGGRRASVGLLLCAVALLALCVIAILALRA